MIYGALGQVALGETEGTTINNVGGIASAEAFGTLELQLGDADVFPVAIGSAETVSTETIAMEGDVIAWIANIASAEALGTPTTILVVAPTGIASAEAFGLASFGIYPTGIASAMVFGTPNTGEYKVYATVSRI